MTFILKKSIYFSVILNYLSVQQKVHYTRHQSPVVGEHDDNNAGFPICFVLPKLDDILSQQSESIYEKESSGHGNIMGHEHKGEGWQS